MKKGVISATPADGVPVNMEEPMDKDKEQIEQCCNVTNVDVERVYVDVEACCGQETPCCGGTS